MGKPVAIVSVLLVVLTYLLIRSQSSDQLPRVRMQQSLQAMQLHDAELNRDVLMARAGLLANYDSLAQTGRKLCLDLETVEKQSAVLAKPAARLITSDVTALMRALRHKLSLVEYLKSETTDAFAIRLAEHLPTLRGNPQRVEQVVVNLVMNALEALPDRSRSVEVSTFFEAEQRAVSFEVRDEGVDIPREHLSRLGEPFFTQAIRGSPRGFSASRGRP